MLGVGVIEDSNAVAIGDFDDLAGEGVGRGRYGEKYGGSKAQLYGPLNAFPYPWNPGFKNLTNNIVVR